MARPEITGKAPITRVAFTIPEFCEAHRICRATYYELKKLNQHPDEVRVLGRILITKESAARWLKRRARRKKQPYAGAEAAAR
jgi:hypothetical protein